jgi:hypothetical protein
MTQSVSKKRVCIAACALVAGLVFVYVRTRTTTPLPDAKRPPPTESPVAARSGADSQNRAPHVLLPSQRAGSPASDLDAASGARWPFLSGARPVSRKLVAQLRSAVPLFDEDVEPLLLDELTPWTTSFEQKLQDGTEERMELAWSCKPPPTVVQSLDVKSNSIGKSYSILDSGDTTFQGGIAGGLSQDYAGLNGCSAPEVVFRFQFEHDIDRRNKFLGTMELGRDIMELGRSRLRTGAAWEVLLDPEKNLSLRTGVEERVQTTVDGDPTKKMDYSLDLIWRF